MSLQAILNNRKFFYAVLVLAALIGLKLLFDPIRDFISIVQSRVFLDYNAEWIEGLILDQARLYAKTGNPYPPPSFEFVPLLYAPGYFFLLQPIVLYSDQPFAHGRMLSLFFFAGSLCFLYVLARTCFSRIYSALAAISVIGFYPHTGYWFDLIRVDSASLFFYMGALAILTLTIKDSYKTILVSFWLIFAVSIKQTNLLAALPVLSYWIFQKKYRYFLVQLGILFSLLLLLFLYWQSKTNGYFLKYAWELGASHGYISGDFISSAVIAIELAENLFPDLTAYLAAICGLFLFAGGLALYRNIITELKPEPRLIQVEFPRSESYLIFCIFSLSAIFLFLNIHPGTYLNNNIPLVFALVLLPGLAGNTLIRILSRLKRTESLKTILQVLPVVLLLIFINREMKAGKIMRVFSRPALPPGQTQEIRNMRKFLERDDVFAASFPVGPVTRWRRKSVVHAQSYADLRNHPELKAEYIRSLKNFPCDRIKIIINFPGGTPPCRLEYEKRPFKIEGVSRGAIRPLSGHVPEVRDMLIVKERRR